MTEKEIKKRLEFIRQNNEQLKKVIKSVDAFENDEYLSAVISRLKAYEKNIIRICELQRIMKQKL